RRGPASPGRGPGPGAWPSPAAAAQPPGRRRHAPPDALGSPRNGPQPAGDRRTRASRQRRDGQRDGAHARETRPGVWRLWHERRSGLSRTAIAMQVWVGTSGYSYSDWVGGFYPAGTRSERMLGWYARLFPLVELNFTFYRMPTAEQLARLAEQTPAG